MATIVTTSCAISNRKVPVPSPVQNIYTNFVFCVPSCTFLSITNSIDRIETTRIQQHDSRLQPMNGGASGTVVDFQQPTDSFPNHSKDLVTNDTTPVKDQLKDQRFNGQIGADFEAESRKKSVASAADTSSVSTSPAAAVRYFMGARAPEIYSDLDSRPSAREFVSVEAQFVLSDRNGDLHADHSQGARTMFKQPVDGLEIERQSDEICREFLPTFAPAQLAFLSDFTPTGAPAQLAGGVMSDAESDQQAERPTEEEVAEIDRRLWLTVRNGFPGSILDLVQEVKNHDTSLSRAPRMRGSRRYSSVNLGITMQGRKNELGIHFLDEDASSNASVSVSPVRRSNSGSKSPVRRTRSGDQYELPSLRGQSSPGADPGLHPTLGDLKEEGVREQNEQSSEESQPDYRSPIEERNSDNANSQNPENSQCQTTWLPSILIPRKLPAVEPHCQSLRGISQIKKTVKKTSSLSKPAKTLQPPLPSRSASASANFLMSAVDRKVELGGGGGAGKALGWVGRALERRRSSTVSPIRLVSSSMEGGEGGLYQAQQRRRSSTEFAKGVGGGVRRGSTALGHLLGQVILNRDAVASRRRSSTESARSISSHHGSFRSQCDGHEVGDYNVQRVRMLWAKAL